ncbi:hypothetical protein HY837_02425 [archaeon]|nr:hypothetical protein [archaeon]
MKKFIVLAVLLLFIIGCVSQQKEISGNQNEKKDLAQEPVPKTREEAVKKQSEVVEDLSTVTKGFEEIEDLLE